MRPFLEGVRVPPHPLALRLIDRLQGRPQAAVLEFASGSGRNARALERAGRSVVEIDDATAASPAAFAGVSGPFAAALSTHGLLHGTPSIIAGNLRQIAERLEEGGLLYATFGSAGDARFAKGERIDEFTYAQLDGEERGVPHAFFDRRRLRALLEHRFSIESIEEHMVDEVAGSWAHRERPLSGAVHWFAVATAK
jgi:SAM-dependent methyltransferase